MENNGTGEVKCSKCKGIGKIKKTGIRENNNCEELEVEYWEECPDCHGTGKQVKEENNVKLSEVEMQAIEPFNNGYVKLGYNLYATLNDIVKKIIAARLAEQKTELKARVLDKISKTNICAICNKINRTECADGFCTKLDIIVSITQAITEVFENRRRSLNAGRKKEE